MRAVVMSSYGPPTQLGVQEIPRQLGIALLKLMTPEQLVRVDTVAFQPSCPIAVPLFEDGFRHRIEGAPGDEADRPCL